MEKTLTSPSLALFEELGGTMKGANGISKWICRQNEFISAEEYGVMKRKKEEPEARKRLAPILEAWEAGHQTANTICAFLAGQQNHIHPLAIRSKMLECHRRGFFQLPLNGEGDPITK